MKKRYVIGTNRLAGSLTVRAEKSGLATSVTASVPVNSHDRLRTPPAAPISSRIGRRMNQLARTKKKYAHESHIARRSSGRTSTTRRRSEGGEESDIGQE